MKYQKLPNVINSKHKLWLENFLSYSTKKKAPTTDQIWKGFVWNFIFSFFMKGVERLFGIAVVWLYVVFVSLYNKYTIAGTMSCDNFSAFIFKFKNLMSGELTNLEFSILKLSKVFMCAIFHIKQRPNSRSSVYSDSLMASAVFITLKAKDSITDLQNFQVRKICTTALMLNQSVQVDFVLPKAKTFLVNSRLKHLELFDWASSVNWRQKLIL